MNLYENEGEIGAGNPNFMKEMMQNVKLIDLVRDNQKVKFIYYRDNEFWYKTDSGFQFPISLDEVTVSKVTLLAEDKAILFMRWIKKYLESFK